MRELSRRQLQVYVDELGGSWRERLSDFELGVCVRRWFLTIEILYVVSQSRTQN